MMEKADPYPEESNQIVKKRSKTAVLTKIFALLAIALLFLNVGILIGFRLAPEKIIEKDVPPETAVQLPETGEESPYLADEPIRSPLNGAIIEEGNYEKIIKNIPHAVMISNNESARDEQYGLSYADIVYEGETESGITRFLAIFWNNQEEYNIKPVRSVRKYYLEWASEYGNIPITFSGFAQTVNPETDSWSYYKANNLRVTYFDWPFSWDEECLKTHPSMHCKSVSPASLYTLFEQKDWTYESWNGFKNKNEWLFSEKLDKANSYKKVEEVTYNFTYYNAWSSKWVYSKKDNTYRKYDPDEKHLDMNNKKQIKAKTLILQIIDRKYTGDDKGRVIYYTVGKGEAFVLRDGIKIPATWEKKCHNCRTRMFSRETPNQEIALNPGLIWIAAIPSDKPVTFK
ncbi:MAG: DUF3048 domain-containing protein [Candidatus Dojkabacteria bacterium]|nr:DUF3048 domain-containing protein [Candidatus Dojkabacteria bacterium]